MKKILRNAPIHESEPDDHPWDGGVNPNADQEALGYALYKVSEPGPLDFDPMEKSTWSWFMLLGWICWRTSDSVRKCCNDYRGNCLRYYREWPPESFQELHFGETNSDEERMVLSDGPMTAAVFYSILNTTGRLKISAKAAIEQLKNALVEGRLAASAADAVSGRPVQIATFEWAHIEVNNESELVFRKASARIAYKDVMFMRADVMRLWPGEDRLEVVAAERDKGGRPAAFDWDVMKEVARELVRVKGFPGKTNPHFKSKTDFTNAIKDRFMNDFNQYPSDSRVRQLVGKWLGEFAEN